MGGNDDDNAILHLCTLLHLWLKSAFAGASDLAKGSRTRSRSFTGPTRSRSNVGLFHEPRTQEPLGPGAMSVSSMDIAGRWHMEFPTDLGPRNLEPKGQVDDTTCLPKCTLSPWPRFAASLGVALEAAGEIHITTHTHFQSLPRRLKFLFPHTSQFQSPD